MSERTDLPRTLPSPQAPAASTESATEQPAQQLSSLPEHPSSAEEEARSRVAALEREAKALGVVPAAALLFHEIGLLWEEPLKNPRHAAVAYQNAYKLAPKFLANIRAARRLFADVGNWQMVVQLIDAELSATDAKEGHAWLLFEKAQVLEQRLSRLEEAQKAYAQVLEANPQDVVLLVQLEQVFAEKADFEPLARVLGRLAEVVPDETLKAHYLTVAGSVLEDRLKRPTEATASYRAAFALDRHDPVLLSAVARVCAREGSIDELLSALAAEAELLGANAAPVYLEISKIYSKLGRREDALAALHAARRVAPTEPLVLSELAHIYEAQERHEELADVLRDWVQSISDEDEVVAINLRLATLYEERLQRDADAIARYQAILSRIPGHATALAGLGKLYHRSQDWAGLLATYDAELAALDDPKQKAARMYKAAEVLEERLGRTEEAVGRYNQCLQLQPGYLPAQKALTRLYEKQGRFAELVAMHEQDLLQTTDREQIISILNKIAAIYEDRLGDREHAAECMRRILEQAPEHLPTLRNLARLYESVGRWRELIEVHEREAGLTGDIKQVISLHHRNAEILEEALQDRPGAIAAYERVLALLPSYLPALRALGRLYAQDGRWDELVRMYRAEAETAPLPEQAAALVHKIGELYEQKLSNTQEAIASYQEVLTLSPTYFPAARALARILREQGDWERLVDVLRVEAAGRTDPVERANTLFQVAAIWEDQLGQPDQAIESYQEVLRLAPNHSTALRALERLYTAKNELREQVTILDRQSQTGQSAAKIAAYLKLARIYFDLKNEPARAAQCCEAVLAIDPANLAALATLARIRANDRVRRAEIKERLAEAVVDPRLTTAFRLSAAFDQELAGGRSSSSTKTAALLQDLKTAGDDTAGPALEKALRAAHDWTWLAALYQARLSGMSDPLERQALLLRLAELHESKLEDLDGAATFYEQALETEPSLLPALQGARRVAIKRGDFARARSLLATEGEVARDAHGALEALVLAGKIAHTKLGDPEGAAAHYRQALERDPLHAAAGAALEEILASRGGAEDLATLHERRAEAKLTQKDLTAAAVELYAAARIHLGQLKDRGRALAAVERALAAQPTHPEALELKGELSFQSGQFAEAAAAYAVRVQQGGDPLHLSAVHLRLAAIYHDELSDVTRAAAHLQTALATNPTSAEALKRLAAIHTVGRNWTGAADCLRRLLEVDDAPTAQAHHTLSLAKVIDEGFGDAAQASALYRKALELAPGDAAITDRLVALYEGMGNLPELVQMLEEQAQHADPERTMTLRLKLGDLYAKRLNELPKAVAAFRAAVELDPACVPAHAALAELYLRDAATAPQAIEEHRTLLRLEPTQLESLHALFRLWESQGQKDKAFCAAGVLTFFRAANDAETAFWADGRSRQPAETHQRLLPSDVEALLHPSARNPLVEVFRAIGDQLTKLHPPSFEQLGIDRKADRLKPDHAIHKAIRAVVQVFGVEELEVYQSRRGMVRVETTDPLSVCVEQDVVRKYNAREQKFLIGRAALGLFNKTAALHKLSSKDAADLVSDAVRIHHPEFTLLGTRSDDRTKQLRKACSRKALKALEAPASLLAGLSRFDFETSVEALRRYSEDRAGLLLCSDVTAGLTMLLRTDPNFSMVRQEGADPVAQAVRMRPDVQELLVFALSEDFFQLRQRLGLAVA
ncbi:MAG: tetratricopeptide repeat protein [Myxococcota bacterium]